MPLKVLEEVQNFGGKLLKLTHYASTTGCEMTLNLFLPHVEESRDHEKFPVLFYLSGLTCTGDNCAQKGFLQHGASQKGIAVVYPDTSPRNPGGLGIPGEDESYDFGSGAGFYIDATISPWSSNYKMESYITSELPNEIFKMYKNLDPTRVSIMGHSMGGHGALTLYLKNPGMYKSVSALAPICNPINCPWGQKAFKGYLGDDQELWKQHDATELVRKWSGSLNCLIDVGTSDYFYNEKQLLPENFAEAVRDSGINQGLSLRYQSGYDHSYYFVSSFAKDHINHAAKFLLV